MEVMNSFGAVKDKKFSMAFPNAERDSEQVKRFYELRKLELSSKHTREARKEMEELDKYYTQAMSEIASSILENDCTYVLENNRSVTLSPEMRNNIKVYKNQLLRKGLIKVEKSKPVCVVCGKTACSGDLFVILHKDNTAACLDCCTSGTKLDKLTDLVFID